MEPYSKLERLRELRDCAKTNHPDAQLTLALEYAKGNLGGVTKTQVAEFTLQVNPCTNLSIFQALVKNDKKWSHLHTTVWNGLYVPFFKIYAMILWNTHFTYVQKVCRDENYRLMKFHETEWMLMDLIILTNFLIKFFKAKSTWWIWQFFAIFITACISVHMKLTAL